MEMKMRGEKLGHNSKEKESCIAQTKERVYFVFTILWQNRKIFFDLIFLFLYHQEFAHITLKTFSLNWHVAPSNKIWFERTKKKLWGREKLICRCVGKTNFVDMKTNKLCVHHGSMKKENGKERIWVIPSLANRGCFGRISAVSAL